MSENRETYAPMKFWKAVIVLIVEVSNFILVLVCKNLFLYVY